MDIRIDNSSEVPIRHQLAEQIVFLTATDRLAAGDALPSVCVSGFSPRLRITFSSSSRTQVCAKSCGKNFVPPRHGGSQRVPATIWLQIVISQLEPWR